MVLYVVVAVLCTAALPYAWRRSGRSMTRYVLGTGAPLVLIALLAFALLALVLHRSDETLAREVFTGGLVGSAFTQFLLLRRTHNQDQATRPESTDHPDDHRDHGTPQ